MWQLRLLKKQIMLTQNQQTVYNWINDDLKLPVYAEAYKGASEQLNNKSSGYITFVSHAGRDLMNGLASTAIGIPGPLVQYVQLIDDFKDAWKDEWGEEGNNSTEVKDENGHLIPIEICKKIKKLLHEHKEGRRIAEEKNTTFFTNFLDYPNKESIPEDLSQEWRRAKRWFVGHARLRASEFSIETYDEAERHFQNLDSFLYAAAASDIEQLRSIHEILEETNR